MPFENNHEPPDQEIRSVLTVLGAFMVLVTLTNPSATPMAAALLLVGVAMIAIATFAGL